MTQFWNGHLFWTSVVRSDFSFSLFFLLRCVLRILFRYLPSVLCPCHFMLLCSSILSYYHSVTSKPGRYKSLFGQYIFLRLMLSCQPGLVRAVYAYKRLPGITVLMIIGWGMSICIVTGYSCCGVLLLLWVLLVFLGCFCILLVISLGDVPVVALSGGICDSYYC